jgi:tRNA pseudouridine55 synthase
MDGLLVVDKPVGPSSHDVVARVRRALGERRIGHTGTLDPAASGVLPLVLGRATRLARFLSASDKVYEAVILLGVATDTHDAEGRPTGAAYSGLLPSRDAIDRALDAFRGTLLQQPPAYSAKKIGGRRSYRLARAQAGRPASSVRTDAPIAAAPAPVPVTAYSIDVAALDGNRLTLRVHVSAGFYVRALAHDLGVRLETGAHLGALRRTRSGTVTLDRARPLEAIEQDPQRAAASVVPLSGMLPEFASVSLTSDGVRHAAHGRNLGPGDISGNLPLSAIPPTAAVDPRVEQTFVRLVDPDGNLVAVGTRARESGLLHPAVVLM